MSLRYAGTCAMCMTALAKGERAHWDPSAKVVTCLGCFAAVDTSQIERGVAGASAQRVGDERSRRREERIREESPTWIANLRLRLSDDPQSTTAWKKGAIGERVVARRLDELVDDGAVVLHDRQVPGSRSNIDHIVVAAKGVFVINAKNYDGKLEQRRKGTLFHPTWHLYIGGRDRTGLIEKMAREAVLVGASLRDASIAVIPVLCIYGEWGFFSPQDRGDGSAPGPRVPRSPVGAQA